VVAPRSELGSLRRASKDVRSAISAALAVDLFRTRAVSHDLSPAAPRLAHRPAQRHRHERWGLRRELRRAEAHGLVPDASRAYLGVSKRLCPAAAPLRLERRSRLVDSPHFVGYRSVTEEPQVPDCSFRISSARASFSFQKRAVQDFTVESWNFTPQYSCEAGSRQLSAVQFFVADEARC
jgi:hypothetical protein